MVVEVRTGASCVRGLIVPREDQVAGHAGVSPVVELACQLGRGRQTVVAVLEILYDRQVASDLRLVDRGDGRVDVGGLAGRSGTGAWVDVEAEEDDRSCSWRVGVGDSVLERAGEGDGLAGGVEIVNVGGERH